MSEEEFKNYYTNDISQFAKESVNIAIENQINEISQILGFERINGKQCRTDMEWRKHHLSYKHVEEPIKRLIALLKGKDDLCQNNGGQYD